ncbi:unnamed protein product [Orchesella dallaii]|uniref:Uncharacterized protein n=1 Tax=Orchesella dallaii TaxID=48710 RepID=A0ABP1R920_9HEXA
MNDSVYNSTTVSYENPGPGPGSPNCRPWNLSEMVAPPVSRTRWFHWTLLIGGIVSFVFGVTVAVIGVCSYLGTPESSTENGGTGETSHSGGWVAASLGLMVALLGVFLVIIYCRLTNNHLFCHRLSNTRNALRKVITKPRFHNAQNNRGANLLSNEPSSFQPTLSAQYDPVPDIVYGQANGDVSEERAKLMAHEAKEGIDDLPISSCERLLTSDSTGTSSSTSNSVAKDPRIVLHPFAKA